ncbi:MAG: carbohydrate ABC transporter permease [Firmicutes bacterium]|nr:carbohydrate ABC transporter permease [Bacillota bacterium]
MAKELRESPLLQTRGDKTLGVIFRVTILAFSAFCTLPFLLVLIASLTDEATLVREGYRIIPSMWSLEAYKAIFSSSTIPDAYAITVFITVAGTFMSMLVTSMLSYSLSCKQLRYRNIIAFFFYFTILFQGGLVPTYVLISKYLRLRNTLWVYLLPYMVSPWYMFLLRNFFSDIPAELKESAKLDGANDARILFQLILPLSLPALATFTLFYALAYWGIWMESMLYMDDKHLYTLQYIIMSIIRNLTASTELADVGGSVVPPTYTIRLATAMVTIGPIIFLYPFLQKYFVGGLKVGGVKG